MRERDTFNARCRCLLGHMPSILLQMTETAYEMMLVYLRKVKECRVPSLCTQHHQHCSKVQIHFKGLPHKVIASFTVTLKPHESQTSSWTLGIHIWIHTRQIMYKQAYVCLVYVVSNVRHAILTSIIVQPLVIKYSLKDKCKDWQLCAAFRWMCLY